MLDEDDTVKDLAIKTMEELWFQGPGFTQRGKSLAVADDKSQLLSKVSVIMGVSSHFKDRHSPLEDLLHQMMVDKGGAEMTSLHTRYSEICEALIDGLVDASDLPGFVSCPATQDISGVADCLTDSCQLCADNSSIRLSLSSCAFRCQCFDPSSVPQKRSHGMDVVDQ